MKIFGIGGPEIAIVLLIALWVVSGFIAKGIGEKKGYGAGLSFCAGFFLFILGIIIMAVLPDKSGKEKAVTSADALLKYKELLDAGAISQEEFDAKKKELLADEK